jgi:hypothetical protein
MIPTSLLLLLLAAEAGAAPQLCEPPVDPDCTITLNPDPLAPDCNPFTMTIDNTDVTNFNDNPTSVAWECRTNCALVPDWHTDCSYESYTSGVLDKYSRWDDVGETLVADLTERRVSMIVDGIGVTLQYTYDTYADGPTVLFHSGGGANLGFDGGAPIRDFLREYSNARTVNIKYELGVPLVGANDGGWQLRPDDTASNYHDLTDRTAQVIAWIDGNLVNSGEGFGTVACSFGTLATLAAPVWHGHDAIIDYQALIGGPPMWSVNAGCGLLGETYMDPYDADITSDPEHGGVSLGSGDYCNTNANQCLTYWPVGSAAFVNHIHMLDDDYAPTCLNQVEVSWPSTDDNLTVLEASSWETVASPDWSLDHVVDFFMDRTVTPPTANACDGTNGCPDNDYYMVDSSVPFTPSVGSDEVLAGPSAVRVCQALLDGGTNATWSWQEGPHCESYQEIGNTAPVIDAVIMGLGVEAVRHELRVVKHEDNFTATDACLEYDAGVPENTFSDSETLTVNGREYRVGTYHDDSGSPELQATIASGAEYFLPDMHPAIATVDRVMMLISGSTGTTYEDLTVTFTYQVGLSTETDSVTAQVPKDDVTVGTFSGEHWDVRAWTGDVTGNGASCDDGAFAVRIRNPRPNAEALSIEVTYGGDLAGPLALTILTDAATWDAVYDANDGSCEVTAPYTTACELEPVRIYWN